MMEPTPARTDARTALPNALQGLRRRPLEALLPVGLIAATAYLAANGQSRQALAFLLLLGLHGLACGVRRRSRR